MNNLQTDQVNFARTSIDQAQNMLIALKSNPTMDEVASGLAFYLALSARGKKINILSPSSMIVEFNQLVGVDKISTNFNGGNGGKNLVISFPYQEGSIEKVSYNIENNTFNLVIEPREGYPQITPDLIRYSTDSGETDLIITIGIQSLSDLNSIYQNNQSLFSTKTVINIDKDNRNQRFGKVNLVDFDASSMSEVIIALFSLLNINLDNDIASNLYSGIVSATNNFTSNQTNANTFEAAAICLKNGAKKASSGFSQTHPSFKQPQPQANFGNMKSTFAPPPVHTPSAQSYSKHPNIPNKPGFSGQQQPQPKIQNQEAPPDWLKPKIYKGSTLL